MAAYWDRLYLLLRARLIINWFGDSLDGRLAYYRNKPRKWYGFSLDITVDWFTTLLIGAGYAIYTSGFAKFSECFCGDVRLGHDYHPDVTK